MATGEVAEREALILERLDARALQDGLKANWDSTRQVSLASQEQWTRALRELESILTSSELQDVLGRTNAERSLRG